MKLPNGMKVVIAKDLKPILMQTSSGKLLDINNYGPGDFDIQDIAHALALQCRYNGHTPAHYSVAQHSVLVSGLLPPEIALYGLLHDAGEAYIGDIIGPIKAVEQGALEKRILGGIYKALDLQEPTSIVEAAVKTADLRILATEKLRLFPDSPEWDCLRSVEACHDLRVRVTPCWPAHEAEEVFLWHFRQYIKGLPL